MNAAPLHSTSSPNPLDDAGCVHTAAPHCVGHSRPMDPATPRFAVPPPVTLAPSAERLRVAAAALLNATCDDPPEGLRDELIALEQAALQLEQARLVAVAISTTTRLALAARTVVAATGGWPPRHIQPELAELEDAVRAFDAGSAT